MPRSSHAIGLVLCLAAVLRRNWCSVVYVDSAGSNVQKINALFRFARLRIGAGTRQHANARTVTLAVLPDDCAFTQRRRMGLAPEIIRLIYSDVRASSAVVHTTVLPRSLFDRPCPLASRGSQQSPPLAISA